MKNLNISFFTQDMDLIEVLWKQDVDLGYAPDISTPLEKPKQLEDQEDSSSNQPTTSITIPTDDDIEKLKALKDLNKAKDDEKVIRINYFAYLSRFVYILIFSPTRMQITTRKIITIHGLV